MELTDISTNEAQAKKIPKMLNATRSQERKVV